MMGNHNSTVAFCNLQTGFNKPPSRVDKPDTSTAYNAYANFLGEPLATLGSQNIEQDAPTGPPQNKHGVE